MEFKAGDFVGVFCEVQPGPFGGEKLITVDTIEGPISGFIKEEELRQIGERWQVSGKVREINGNSIKVLIYGSFFTTNGIANIDRNLAMAA